VVDDEPGLADGIAELLRLHGHQVVTASSGADALRTRPATPYHLVLSDLLMPGLRGDDLLRAMRTRPGPPFWFALMSSMPEEIVRQRTVDYDRFLAKPLELEQLDAMLRDCAESPDIAARLGSARIAGTG
jgi:two-component system OmpR family response regulator